VIKALYDRQSGALGTATKALTATCLNMFNNNDWTNVPVWTLLASVDSPHYGLNETSGYYEHILTNYFQDGKFFTQILDITPFTEQLTATVKQSLINSLLSSANAYILFGGHDEEDCKDAGGTYSGYNLGVGCYSLAVQGPGELLSPLPISNTKRPILCQ
jgi:hypothetical protein